MKNVISSLLIAATLASTAGGCVVRARGEYAGPGYVEVDEDPPPPPATAVVYTERPGFVWVQGRYYRRGNRWQWSDGRYERERANQRWEQGRWERRGRGRVYVEGGWRSGGGERDHRRGPANPPPGPIVRDHR